MERGAVALQVLYGVGVGVEHVGVVYHDVRRLRGALYEIVVVGIDARYHVAATLSGYHAHDGGLLAALKTVGARGQHHLEVARVVLEACEHGTPEEHVVVALHIGYDTAARVP